VLKVRNWVVLFHNVLPCTSFPIFFYLSWKAFPSLCGEGGYMLCYQDLCKR
jgi:hypothetical protein